MKKFMLPLLVVLSVPAFADDIELDNLTKNDVENITEEFSANFSHTVVAAPETDGLWGVEVGVAGGVTGSPELKDVINEAGGEGDDFKKLYHAALIARAHFPYDIFLEGSYLPERDFSDLTIESNSFGLGWNAGAFFNLPLDLAIGGNISHHEISFDQTINNASTANTDVESTIALDGDTRVYYVAASKTFLFVTPYVKFGMAHQDSNVKVKGQGSIFANPITAGQKEDASTDGAYFVAGANLQLAFFKLGFEWGKTFGVSRASGKISFDF